MGDLDGCRYCRDWVPLCESWGGEDFGACWCEVFAEAGPDATGREVLDAVARVARPSWGGPAGHCDHLGEKP